MVEQTSIVTSRGKLAATSENFRNYFMLIFTKELIKHSTEDFHKLDHTIKKKGTELIKKKDKIEKTKKKTRPKDPFYLSVLHQFPRPKHDEELIGPAPKLFREMPKLPTKSVVQPPMLPPQQRLPQRRGPSGPVSITHPPLPPNLQYLQPYPTNIEIDLGKLESLGRDPAVRIIECNGPDELITVRGNMGTRQTKISLNRDEIDELLGVFSQASKIPLHEGIFKIVVGKYILSAIISSVVGTKFIINKMQPQMRPPLHGMNPTTGMPPRQF